MAQPLIQYRSPQRTNKRNTKLIKKKPFNKVDAQTRAALFQKQEEDREFIYSLIGFLMKLGLLSLGIASLFKLSFASHKLVSRQIELSSAIELEMTKFNEVHKRFDRLFTIGGKSRLMDEQVQWIKPNSMRVIWR